MSTVVFFSDPTSRDDSRSRSTEAGANSVLGDGENLQAPARAEQLFPSQATRRGNRYTEQNVS